jgi:mRNA interferase RelE/StbE
MVLAIPLMLLLLPLAFLVGGIRKLFLKKPPSVEAEKLSEDRLLYSRPVVLFRQPPDEPPLQKSWLISLSKEFMKQVRSIDRKLQGRILDAIAEIASAPYAAVGDTCRPLRGDMVGAWRYRIGDYRLVYRPDDAKQTVHLVAFGSRGSIYEE